MRINEPSHFVKTLLINILSIMLLVSAFDTVAVYFSNRDSFRINHYYYHHGLKPMTSDESLWGDMIEEPYSFYTNSLSFRDFKPRKVSLKKNGERFVFMGDSFVEGVGLDYEKTFAGIVTQNLAEKGIEVLNPSVISYSPKLYYLKMKYYLEKGLELDELFLFIDVSDIIDEVYYDYFGAGNKEDTTHNFRFFDRFFSKHSYIYYLLKVKFFDAINSKGHHYWGGLDEFYFLKPQWTFNDDAYNLYGKEGKELAIKHVDALWKLCKSRNIKMHIVVWPWKDNLLNNTGNRQRDLWLDFSLRREINFVHMFDLFRSIPKDEIESYFISRDCHWNESGNKLVADFMTEFFEDYLSDN